MDLDQSTCTAMLDAMPNLRRYARSLCRDGDMADDLTQETQLRSSISTSSESDRDGGMAHQHFA
jgi:DNA-directed RNA polymerase specialized sigma24 family protein